MLLLRWVCNLWVKFIRLLPQLIFSITFFASKKAAKDGHRAEFSEEELQVRGGPLGHKSFMNCLERRSGCGNKLANSDFELLFFSFVQSSFLIEQ